MGIVMKQSAANLVVTYIGFAIGAVNTVFLYETILGTTNFGLVQFILSTGTILMPILAFGAHNTLIRFFVRYQERERDEFLSFILLLPLLAIIPAAVIGFLGHDYIVTEFFARNKPIQPYLWTVPLIGLFMAYFEIFYAWVKVHLKSVFGNFINEVLVRSLVLAGLFAVYFGWLSAPEFICSLVFIYGCQMVAMIVFAFSVKRPVLRFRMPSNRKELLVYSLTTILSGGIAVSLGELDKFILGVYGLNKSTAIYTMSIFIATVIAVPSRSMLQILSPLTAKLMHEKNHVEMDAIYKKSAITLQYIGGGIMLLIFLNIHQMYLLIPGKYDSGTLAVFFIGLAKFYDVILGNNNIIILNTRYYRSVLAFGTLLVVLVVGLNLVLIPLLDFTGSALATLLSVMVYNTIKLWFVVKKTGYYPFTSKTWTSFAIIGLIFLVFYFWEFPFHPFLNIFLKSGLIAGAYVFLNHLLDVSPDINALVGKSVNRILPLKRKGRPSS